MTLFNNTNNFTLFFDTLFSMFVRIDLTDQISSKSEWFFNHLKISHWDYFFVFFVFFVFSKIHFLVTISMSIRNFSKFLMFFFLSKNVLNVIVWDFISLIMINRWFVKWRQCNNRCFEVWIKLQFSLHLFVS
jgi:hypothetical protein